MKDPDLEKLNQALIANDKNTIEQMLAADKKLANRRDELGRGPLDMAVSRSNSEVVALLLSNGAVVNKRENVDGASPLMQAVCRKRAIIVKLLLDHGADPMIRNSTGESALDMAKTIDDKETMEVITKWRKEKASPSVTDLIALSKTPVKLNIGSVHGVKFDLRMAEEGLNKIAELLNTEVFLPLIQPESSRFTKCSYEPGCSAVHKEIEAILGQFTDAQRRHILHCILWIRHSNVQRAKSSKGTQLELPLPFEKGL